MIWFITPYKLPIEYRKQWHKLVVTVHKTAPIAQWHNGEKWCDI